jgi:hypothetical protein
MKIAFANWIISRLALAHWGLMAFVERNPIVNNGQFTNYGDVVSAPPFDAKIAGELVARAGAKHYVFPLMANYTMRMMTPAKKVFWGTQNCPPAPP